MRRPDIYKNHELFWQSLLPDAPRVTGHTISGVPCILAGLNRHDGDLTMPSHFKVADVLDRDWIRMATKEEKAQHGKWYHVLSFKPATVIYNNGTCAGPHDPVGLFGHYITVLAQEPVDTSKYFRCADVDDVPTPPTPPPFYPESQSVRDVKKAVLQDPNGPRSRRGLSSTRGVAGTSG